MLFHFLYFLLRSIVKRFNRDCTYSSIFIFFKKNSVAINQNQKLGIGFNLKDITNHLHPNHSGEVEMCIELPVRNEGKYF